MKAYFSCPNEFVYPIRLVNTTCDLNGVSFIVYWKIDSDEKIIYQTKSTFSIDMDNKLYTTLPNEYVANLTDKIVI